MGFLICKTVTLCVCSPILKRRHNYSNLSDKYVSLIGTNEYKNNLSKRLKTNGRILSFTATDFE